MLKWRSKAGFTLIEMLVAVAIIAVLASLVLTVATRIDSKGKETQCEGLMATLNCALRQFCEYGYEYRPPNTSTDDELAFYRGLKFPLDCNDYIVADVEREIAKALDLPSSSVNISPSAKYDPCESSCAVMYFFLSQVPDCRETLQEIGDEFLIGDHDNDKDYMRINVDGRDYPWLRAVDPWGTTLNYDYYDEEAVQAGTKFDDAIETLRTFPLITSAGPDEEFGTDDDITNRIKTKGTSKL